MQKQSPGTNDIALPAFDLAIFHVKNKLRSKFKEQYPDFIDKSQYITLLSDVIDVN
jgi:hypothetical protein